MQLSVQSDVPDEKTEIERRFSGLHDSLGASE